MRFFDMHDLKEIGYPSIATGFIGAIACGMVVLEKFRRDECQEVILDDIPEAMLKAGMECALTMLLVKLLQHTGIYRFNQFTEDFFYLVSISAILYSIYSNGYNTQMGHCVWETELNAWHKFKSTVLSSSQKNENVYFNQTDGNQVSNQNNFRFK